MSYFTKERRQSSRKVLFSKRTRRRNKQRILRFLLVLSFVSITWVYVIVTFGVFFYHGGQIEVVHSDQKERVPPGTGTDPAAAGRKKAAFASPLLIFTANRANYLKETLEDIVKYIPHDCSIGCPVVISQDGTNDSVSDVIDEYETKLRAISVPLIHLRHTSALRGRGGSATNAYQALAVHYGWALRQILNRKDFVPERVIILEEDLHIAPDFFSYFSAVAPLLDQDPTLLAASAFNDNGFDGKVKDTARLLRSDFFPGLGWMMTSAVAKELLDKWPSGYWDDWLREPDQRRDRQILRPEVSRTFHFGTQGGASKNQFGSNLSKVRLDADVVDWLSLDLSYLEPDHYREEYYGTIRHSKEVHSAGEALDVSKSENVRISYKSLNDFRKLAGAIELMTDEKAGIPRTSYQGIVETRPHGEHFIFLVPAALKF